MQLKKEFRYKPLGAELLPEKFTLLQLQKLYEAIYEIKLDKGNFRKKVLSVGHLEETDETLHDVGHRKPRLYRFHTERYQELLSRGVYIDILPKGMG